MFINKSIQVFLEVIILLRIKHTPEPPIRFSMGIFGIDDAQIDIKNIFFYFLLAFFLFLLYALIFLQTYKQVP